MIVQDKFKFNKLERFIQGNVLMKWLNRTPQTTIAVLPDIKFSKNDQLVLIYIILQGSKALIGITLVAVSLVLFTRQAPDALHVLLLGAMWIPTIELLPAILRNPYPFFWFRVISTFILLILWYQTGTWVW